VRLDPATAVAGPVFRVTTSALLVIVVMTRASGLLPLLLSGLGSGLLDVLLAVLAMGPPMAGTAKLTVLLALTALAREAIGVQVTIPVVAL
jgi:hypothetical protein